MGQQARDEAGNIWGVDAQGNPTHLISRADTPPVIGRPDPFKVKTDQRGDNADRRGDVAQQMEAIRLQMQRDTQARTDREATDKRRTQDARGGVDTTEGERTSAFLANRVAGGIQDLQRIGVKGAPTLYESMVGDSKVGNFTIPESRQRVSAAQADILDAALTLGTGAAYSKEQLAGYTQSYFPQPGDGPNTIADKKVRLQRLLDAAKVKAGAASGQIIDTALKSAGMFEPAPVAKDFDPSTVKFDKDGNMVIDVQGQQQPPPSAPPGASPPPAPGGGYSSSVLGQGMSGVNEGIANTLGAPVDLATLAMNLVPQGINALANTNIPTIKNPFLGSESIKDGLGAVGSIFPNDNSNPFARRVGQSVGAAVIPVGGTASTVGRAGAGLLSAAGGGIGAATANQLFPGNPYADMAGDVLGSGFTAAGMFGNASRKARLAAEAAVPTIPQLKTQASALYDAAESRGIVAGPNVTTNLAGRIGDIANNAEVTGSALYPHANEASRVLGRYSGQTMNPTQMQVVREGLSDGVQATEGRQRKIARDMLSAFDAETSPLAPELAQARGVASRYLQAEDLGRSLEKAEPGAAQMTQSGPANALRTQFRGLDRAIIDGRRQFNPAVEEAIQQVSRGTPATNALFRIGKFAPTGPVSASLSAGVPFAIGTAFGGPQVGALASGVTMGAGATARMFANRAVERAANNAELIARNGGPVNVPNVMDDDLRRQMIAQLAALGYRGPNGR